MVRDIRFGGGMLARTHDHTRARITHAAVEPWISRNALVDVKKVVCGGDHSVACMFVSWNGKEKSDNLINWVFSDNEKNDAQADALLLLCGGHDLFCFWAQQCLFKLIIKQPEEIQSSRGQNSWKCNFVWNIILLFLNVIQNGYNSRKIGNFWCAFSFFYELW